MTPLGKINSQFALSAYNKYNHHEGSGIQYITLVVPKNFHFAYTSGLKIIKNSSTKPPCNGRPLRFGRYKFAWILTRWGTPLPVINGVITSIHDLINGSLGVTSLLIPVITLCITGSGAHLGSTVTGSHIFISNYRGTKVLFRRQPHLGFLETCWTFEKWRTPKFYPDIFFG